MHLRLVPIAGSVYRIVTLRPGTKVCFSTNFFHQTWHIVTSQQGSRLLARLLWGLSYQHHPGTLLLIHGDHLLPTPFEAERSDPILIARTGLTRIDPSVFRFLKGQLHRLGPPTTTIRWQSFGLDAALQDDAEEISPLKKETDLLRTDEGRQLWRQERMGRLGGFVVYSAPAQILRQQALRIHDLKVCKRRQGSRMDYHFLARESGSHSWIPDGEVQIFADYMDGVAAATQARREHLLDPDQPILSETIQEAVSRRRDRIKWQRIKNKRPFRSGA